MTGLGIEDVLRWRPEVLGRAGDGSRAAGRCLGVQQDRLESVARATTGQWTGAAGTAALCELGLGSRLASGLLDTLTETGAALALAERELDQARQRVALLVREAQAVGLSVHDDGTVRAPAHLTLLEGAAASHRAQQEEAAGRLSRQLRAALDEAGLAERAAGVRLSRITLPEPLESDASRLEKRTGSAYADLPPLVELLPWTLAAMSPDQAASWWRSLRFDQQQQMIHDWGPLIGSLDGVPAWARDQANREQLSRLRARLEAELTLASAYDEQPYGGPGTAYPVPSDTALIGRLTRKLEALDRVEEVLAQGGRQLLLLDADSGRELHAAVAIGDVDTAAAVAVFTPGLTSTVQGSLRGYDRNLAALKARADQDTGDASTTATVSWLGYDAPQLGGLLSLTRSVASSRLAHVGGDRLSWFFQGLNAAREDQFHLTALGHSYGSTTTGYALRHSHVGVDDVVFFGCPGTSARHSSELHVPAGHLYDLAAANDLVADLGHFGRLPQLMKGVEVLSTHAVPGRHLREVTGHTHYLTPGSTSQWNLAAVVVGEPSLLIRGPSIEQPEWLSRFR